MAELIIHRGSRHIGGCCSKINCGGERILIDFGANLPDTDSPVQDGQLVKKVFSGGKVSGLLFTHPHGNITVYIKKSPQMRLYIGPMEAEKNLARLKIYGFCRFM